MNTLESVLRSYQHQILGSHELGCRLTCRRSAFRGGGREEIRTGERVICKPLRFCVRQILLVVSKRPHFPAHYIAELPKALVMATLH
jgi:hypothetical protein